MKKTLIFTSILFLFLFLATTCQASFNVNPLELSITMEDELIQGNTLKSIEVINNDDSDVNISWYLDNPSLDLMRPNKTFIPNLNWVDLEPKWQVISPGNSTDFFIYLDIPEDESNANQSWEIWVTFKQSEKQFINIEQAVRLYIDTPNEITTIPDDDSDDSPVDFIIIIIALLIVSFILIKKKRYNF
jgi:hypothetical protein